MSEQALNAHLERCEQKQETIISVEKDYLSWLENRNSILQEGLESLKGEIYSLKCSAHRALKKILELESGESFVYEYGTPEHNEYDQVVKDGLEECDRCGAMYNREGAGCPCAQCP